MTAGNQIRKNRLDCSAEQIAQSTNISVTVCYLVAGTGLIIPNSPEWHKSDCSVVISATAMGIEPHHFTMRNRITWQEFFLATLIWIINERARNALANYR